VFSDIPGNVRYRWSPATGIRDDLRPSDKTNGHTFDAVGNLLACHHATSNVVREAPDGTRTAIATHFDSREFNSPNDIVVRSDGSIYFTDPYYGRRDARYGLVREQELDFQGVYRIDPDGSIDLVVDRDLFETPNGLCFSLGEEHLFINDTVNGLIRRFDVAVDGSLAGEQLFAAGVASDDVIGRPDGMKCDELGNIWVTGPGGVWVFDSAGERIDKVAVPEKVGNLTFGGPDWRTLFITASTSLYAIDLDIGPRREPYMG
jgi:gluconolactonase